MFNATDFKEVGRIWEKNNILNDIAFREKELQKWTSTLTNCELHKFDDAGHYPHEEKNEEIGQVVENYLR